MAGDACEMVRQQLVVNLNVSSETKAVLARDASQRVRNQLALRGSRTRAQLVAEE